VTLHLTTFEGDSSTNTPISALSDFRAQRLLPKLHGIDSKIVGISARFVHLVATETAPSDSEKAQIAALLSYGEPCKAADGKKLEEAVFIVSPRLGTVSPWASKATDIARNCGLAVKRIERITQYHVLLKSGLFGKAALTEEQRSQVAALLHDGERDG
jgi:phosphoribosylformylglycinamidine synthase